ncbi:ABC transporter substrate-binding protein [Nonomuraea sp. NPDC048916]|uniref:ABC transporter substrate-binding protein n=1 Tax=Nonomuraea sp. NPDC048916 TaxID=3154232 RepID=UPI0033F72C1E
MTLVTRGRRVVAAIALAVTAVACSGTAEIPPKKVPLEKNVIKVGVMPSADSAPLFVAQAKGYFEQEGLTVEPVMVTGAAASLPPLKSGLLDLAQTDYVSAFKAHDHDADIRVVADLYQAAPDVFNLMVRADSRVKTVAGLKGRTILVNNLNGLATLATQAMLKEEGLTAEDVKFVEVPFPEMKNALAQRNADAAWLPEPWVTLGLQDDFLRRLADPMTGDLADLPVGGWAATGDWSARNPATLAAFQRALAKGQRAAAGSRAEVEAVLPTYTKIDTAAVAKTRLGVYPTGMDTGRLQRVVDLMRDFRYVEGRLDVKSVVVG